MVFLLSDYSGTSYQTNVAALLQTHEKKASELFYRVFLTFPVFSSNRNTPVTGII